MKYLDGKYYVELKVHRYEILPTENNILRERKQPKSLTIQNQIQIETKTGRNQKVNKNENNQLEFINYPKNKNLLFRNEILVYFFVLIVEERFR